MCVARVLKISITAGARQTFITRKIDRALAHLEGLALCERMEIASLLRERIENEPVLSALVDQAMAA